MAEPVISNEPQSNFTPSAVAALALAEEEARRHNQDYIGTEHQLLGLLRQGIGLGTTNLTNLGVDLPRLTEMLQGIIRQAGPSSGDEIRLTPRAERVLELAAEEARRLGHQFVGQEHLLLGFLSEGDGIAGRLLMAHCGITLERLRAELARMQALVRPGAPATAPKNNVVTCRLTEDDVRALDDLVEAGVRSTRSDAAAWLIHVGIEANAQLLETVRGTVAAIRRLREHAQALAQQVTDATVPPAAAPALPAEPPPA